MKKIFALLVIASLMSCNEVTHRKLGKEQAIKDLNETLTDTTQPNFVDNKELIVKNESIAVSIAEPILFEIYGKSNIEDQRPYETYFINNHWVIRGTLNRFSLGGTFLIIIDARNSKVLKIIHGK